MLNKRFNRGDTLIEVLLGVTVFSLIAIGGMSIMNQGTATAQRTLEVNMVRQEIDSQAETLRFMHAAHINSLGSISSSVWRDEILPNRISGNATTFGTLSPEGACVATHPTESFILNTRTATVHRQAVMQLAETYSQLRYDGFTASSPLMSAQGIWIEPVAGTYGGSTYTDFHIRACWESPGQGVPSTLGTIVRLYEP